MKRYGWMFAGFGVLASIGGGLIQLSGFWNGMGYGLMFTGVVGTLGAGLAWIYHQG